MPSSRGAERSVANYATAAVADRGGITTRANTEVDAIIEGRSIDGGVPISLVPRVSKDGTPQVELLQPVAATLSIGAESTVIVVTPGARPDLVRLIFVTTTIEPSSVRPGR